MKTDALIERLAADAAPVRRSAAARTLALGLGVGAFVSAAAMLAWIGIRADSATAMAGWPYWMKFAYTLAVALIALGAVERLARPGARARAAWQSLPLGAMALGALVQWLATPDAEHMHLLLGVSHTVCPWRIVALAMPVFAGLLWSLRRLAPTRPAVAGAAAGVLAGAAGAWIYAFACAESSVAFVAVWYTAGIALTGLLGALIGRWALRW